MTRANFSKGRVLPIALASVLVALSAAQPALSQTQDSEVSSALDPVDPVSAADLDGDIERADRFFLQGQQALTEGREAEAQAAFDAALDVFVASRGQGGSDPRFQPAYLAMVARIHSAEVFAGNTRRFLPPTPSLAPMGPPGETLAEMGKEIESSQPTEEARASNTEVMGTEEIDLPIEMNNQVLGAIDLYSGKFRNWFGRALSRGQPHLPRIREILAEAGIPQDLAYVPIVESAFNPVALSRAKAKGLWQFMPATGKYFGLKQDYFVDERSNMEKATYAAAQYLKKLYGMFGDWNLALAGYNAGEGRVQRAIKKAGTDDFWALTKTKSFRAETKNYVPLIHAAIIIAKSPQSYGIDLTPQEPIAAETVRVVASYPIATVARCGDTEPSAIKALNPDLRRGMTPSRPFDLQVPLGAGGQITECLARQRPWNFTRHEVRRGETLSTIGQAFGTTASELARVNGLTLRSKLRVGMELSIPRSARSASTVSGKTSKSKKTVAARNDNTSYRIRRGDTLSQVAARHSTTVAAIKALNGLRSSRLSVGQVLVVSSPDSDIANN